MKKLIFVLFSFLFAACKTNTVYVPVETVKTEYKETIFRDSVYLHDSVLVRLRGDTVFFEKYKTVYKNKFVRDSVFVCDSIQVPYPVVETMEVNRLSGFQWFQVWCGRILLILGMGYVLFRWGKRLL